MHAEKLNLLHERLEAQSKRKHTNILDIVMMETIWFYLSLHGNTSKSLMFILCLLQYFQEDPLFWKVEFSEAKMWSSHSVRKHANRMDATLWWRPYWCPRMLLTQNKCFCKIWTNSGAHPKLAYSCRISRFPTDYGVWLLQHINGVYGFMWTHVVSMGDSERERWRYWDQTQNHFVVYYSTRWWCLIAWWWW